MDLNEIYTEIITEHNLSGRNKRPVEAPTAAKDGINPSCGDQIRLELRVKNDIIEDIAFAGTGCAISQASASIMADLVRGKTVAEAKRLIGLFFGMIKNEVTDEKQLAELDEALALQNIAHMPARVKCAVLGWHTLENALGQPEKKNGQK